jgi:predicted transcriptional regulator
MTRVDTQKWCRSGPRPRFPPLLYAHLDISGYVNQPVPMQSIKISSKVDADTWEELKALARESHQNVSGLLTEAINDYLQRKRVRPVVLKHLEDSMTENEELGKLLAK